jgi:hypothetical protein
MWLKRLCQITHRKIDAPFASHRTMQSIIAAYGINLYAGGIVMDVVAGQSVANSVRHFP